MDRISWWRTTFGPETSQAIAQAIEDEHISQGPLIPRFEEQIATQLGVPYALTATSGTVALLMACMALGIQAGDGVIIPDHTFIASAHAPLHLGAHIRLIDCRPDDANIDLSRIRPHIDGRTRAIMAVHRNGRSVDMPALHALSKEFGLAVIEDACQAAFSRNRDGYLGTQSDIGCFSLGMTKLLPVGQGGLLVTRDAALYERLRWIRNHGLSGNENVFLRAGLNFRTTDLAASIAMVQLSRVPRRLTHLRAVYAKYAEGLAPYDFIKLLPVQVERGEVPLWIEVLSSEREEIRSYLTNQGIDTSPFRPPLHCSPHLAGDGEFPHSQRMSDQGFCLPCGPEQPLENVERVLFALANYAATRSAPSAVHSA